MRRSVRDIGTGIVFGDDVLKWISKAPMKPQVRQSQAKKPE